MTVARSGRFAGERAPAFVALNSSLALDWRLWPEDIEGSVAHARALRGAGVLSAAELEADRGGPRRRRPRDRVRRLRPGRRRRGRAHGRSSAGSRSSSATPAPACTPAAAATTRWSPTCACTCAASSSARTRRCAALQGVLLGTGGRPRRDGAARLHAPAARPGHVAGAAPAGVLLDARARPLAARGRPRRPASSCRSGRAPRSASTSTSTARPWPPTSASSASPRTPSTRSPSRDFVARLPGRGGAARRALSAASAPSSSCGRAPSSASCACPTPTAAARASCRRRRTRTPPS